MDIAYGFVILEIKMSRMDKQPVPGVITSDAVYHRFPGRTVFIVLGFVVALVVAGGVYFAAAKYHFLSANNPSPTTPNHKQDTAQAVHDAQSALQRADTPAEKAAAYNNLGSAYIANNQSSQAVSAYQSALSQNQTSSVKATSLSGLANAYLQAGNRQAAADALTQLVAIYQSGTDEQRALVPKYQRLIQELQGSATIPS